MFQVIGFSLFLIDSTACNINKLDAKKKINVSRIDRIFKVSKSFNLIRHVHRMKTFFRD